MRSYTGSRVVSHSDTSLNGIINPSQTWNPESVEWTTSVAGLSHRLHFTTNKDTVAYSNWFTCEGFSVRSVIGSRAIWHDYNIQENNQYDSYWGCAFYIWFSSVDDITSSYNLYFHISKGIQIITQNVTNGFSVRSHR